MHGKMNDSKKIAIAVISLCFVALYLAVFSVMVYKGKRSNSEENFDVPVYSGDDFVVKEPVSMSDMGEESQENAESSETGTESVSSQTDNVSSAAQTTNEDILNPDNQSEYYMVVYLTSQTIVAYQKDDSGAYTTVSNAMQCSTGKTDTSPTAEGVYTLGKKEKWTKLKDDKHGHYGCLISSSDNKCYISSLSFRQKNAWTMQENAYESLGNPVTAGDIQLCVRDAYWIYTNVPEGTQINVVNKSGPDVKLAELPVKLKKNGGWDPTDKWAKGNPYFD